MIIDTFIDNRNSDPLRQTSFGVDCAVAIFLRDLFGLLEATSVHRLILVYLSRFVVKEGKQWQYCEIAKLDYVVAGRYRSFD
jgi:hypothetical protein